MNRDNFLFTAIGLLAGFIAGYLMHEVMAARQPPLRVAGAQSTAQGAASGAPPAAAGAQAQASMEQVQRLRAYVEENPEDKEALRLLANLNFDINNWSRAAELYQRYLTLDPGDFDVMTDLGVCLRSMGEHDRALEVFRDVIARAPKHWQARFNEVIVLAFDLGKLDAAQEAVQDLKALQPDNPDVERLAAEVERRAAGA